MRIFQRETRCSAGFDALKVAFMFADEENHLHETVETADERERGGRLNELLSKQIHPATTEEILQSTKNSQRLLNMQTRISST
jgi:hypothetical protein